MGFFNEIKAVLIPKVIVFKKMKKEDDGSYTFVFDTTKPLQWQSGKHAMFFITHKKIDKAMRLFSISSCPTENEIAITTKIGAQCSAYKKALLELKPGMKMKLRGPMGPFVLEANRTNCFIAGGIGITPFRSMMKEIEMSKQSFDGDVKLLYINSTGPFLFGDELKAMEKTNISTEFFNDKQLLMTKIKQMNAKSNTTIYFVAGSKDMTTSIKQVLIELGVKKKNIKTDTFIGY